MSDLFVWDPSQYSLEIEAMDQQHLILIGLMNKLAVRADAGAPKAELSAALRELGRFTVKHFDAEEAYMRSFNYPKIETHRAIHKDLLRSLHEHIDIYEAGDGRLSPKVLQFLKLWLGAHIKGIDKQYAAYSRESHSA
jgi:hemerythrin-like metal-binding protein